MKKWPIIMLLPVIMGCASEVITDPETGETETVYSLDPAETAQYEAVGEGAVGILGILSGFYPVLAPIAGIGAGILATWRKVKPQLAEATKKSELSYKGGQILTSALEEIKTTQPELWKKIAPTLEKAQQPITEVENVIRGFRGLEPK